MMIRTTMTAAALALIMGLGQAQAQNLRDGVQPAEFPPSSFTGKQYVDSKGCVFVRAGFDGAINWVPRVNRKRKVLCGMSPSFAERPAAAEPTRVVAAPRAAPTVPARTVAAPVPVRTRAVAPPVRTRAISPAVRTATAPVRTRPAPTYTQPRTVTTPTYGAPRRVTAPTYGAPRTVTAPARSGTRCANMSALSQRYMQSTSRHPVRCGPQGTSATGISYDGPVDREGTPLQVIRVAPPPKITPPAGYKAVWEDDRLNPNRGVQTAEGYYQSSLVWTNTVPRQLIDSRSGRNVTRLFPWLKFPFTSRRSMEAQVAYRLRIGENPRGRVVPVTRSTTRLSTKAVAPARAVAVRRAVAPTRPTAVPAGHRYVQVGTFSVPANAQNSAARLQGMGLPVRIGNYQKAGKSYRIVLAGPFNSASSLSAGLTAARRAGFSDAYTRK